MKNLFLLFILPFFLVFLSLDLSAVQLEDKGGTVQVVLDKKGGSIQVVLDKDGQALAQLDIPKRYWSTGQTTIEISLLNTKTGQVIFSTKSRDGQVIDLSHLATGAYLMNMEVNGYQSQILVSL